MTIQEANRYLFDRLTNIYDEVEASNIADWVMENVTGTKRTDRFAHKNRPLDAGQTEQIEQVIKRLMTHEPIQYVLHEAWFCGLKFYVDKNVLIPRPETEELVEWIISDCKFPIDKLSILDIGSGSGCIPIALKRRLGKAVVRSCDISPAALEVARRNAVTLGVDVHFTELDFLDKEKRDSLPSFDIIVSNPPYIPEKDKKEMRLNVLDHEPGTALFVPDNDALAFYKAIAEFGKKHLNKHGVIYTEINESLGEATTAMFESEGYSSAIKKDMQGKERMIRAWVNRS
jgi:release factor glutamine methyltransferase